MKESLVIEIGLKLNNVSYLNIIYRKSVAVI